ncbi:MAG: hypothetical protein RL141_269 [Candidatus Parcubacteria bacterium]|jgi:hypothetical protein
MPNIDDWKFSLGVAWDDPWYRWQSLATAMVATVGVFLFLWRMIPEGVRSGLLVFHYNLYIGIDEVQPWPVVIPLVLAFLAVVGADLLASGFLFRRDRVASRVLMCAASVFCTLGLVGGFFLVLVNV